MNYLYEVHALSINLLYFQPMIKLVNFICFHSKQEDRNTFVILIQFHLLSPLFQIISLRFLQDTSLLVFVALRYRYTFLLKVCWKYQASIEDFDNHESVTFLLNYFKLITH